MAKISASQFLSQFEEPEDQSSGASKWASQFDDSPSTEETVTKVEPGYRPKLRSETIGGKISETAQDIYIGGAGSLIGAGIGQTLLPIPGVGAFVGGVIGGAAGAVASKGLNTFNDYVDSLLSDREFEEKNIAKGLATEAGFSAGTDVAVQTALTVLPPVVRGTAKGVGKLIPDSTMTNLAKRVKMLNKLEFLSKQSERLKRVMVDTRDRMKPIQIDHDSAIRKAEREKISISEKVSEVEEGTKEIKENLDSTINNILDQRAQTITGLIKPFSEALDLTGKEFKSMYSGFKEEFGDTGINIFDEIISLKKAVESIGLDAFDSSAINKINRLSGLLDERIALKTQNLARANTQGKVFGDFDFNAVQPGTPPVKVPEVFNVSEAIEMKQDMYDISRSIFERKGGSAVKSGIGQDIKGIINNLDNKINTATGGASSDINTMYNGYRTIHDVTKSIVKDFEGELGGKIGERLTEKQFGKIFSGYFDKLSSLDKQTVDRIVSGKETVSNYASNTVDKIMELPNALLYTGDTELIFKGQKMLEQLNNLQKEAFNVVNLKDMAENALKGEADYIKKIQRQSPDIKLMRINFADELEPIERELAESQIRVNEMREKGINISESLGMSKKVMETRFAGLMAANLVASTGNYGISHIMRALTYASSMSKFSPTLARVKLNLAKKAQSLISFEKIPFETKVILSKTINSLISDDTKGNVTDKIASMISKQ